MIDPAGIAGSMLPLDYHRERAGLPGPLGVRPGRAAIATDALIVAVDASLTSTGIAWLDRSGHIGVMTQRERPVQDPMRSGWGPSIRRTRITNAIRRRLTPGCLLAKEDRLNTLHVKGNAALDLAALHASIEDIAQLRDVPIANVNVGRVKIYGSGHGKADKAAQIAAAVRELGDVVEIYNDDEADVVFVLAIACHVAGLPIVRLNKRRLEVVGQCRAGWPDDGLWRKEEMPTRLVSRLRSTP